MSRQPYPIAREAFPYLLVLGLATLAVWWFNPVLAFIPLFLFLFVAFFFRNPKRIIPPQEELIVSPADGRVMEVEPIEHDDFIGGKAKRVTIFLSVFNVHLNRCPIHGEVVYRHYQPGKMLAAYKKEAREENERNYVGIENPRLRVMVIQITGLIARTIVSWVNIGDKVERGEQFGLIKFGSCTEIVVPDTVEISVAVGEKVIGGETIIGRLKDEF